MTTLVTDRLTLTPAAAGDFDEVRRLWGDPAFATAIFPNPLSAEDVWTRLLRDIGHWAVVGHGNWTIRLRDTGEYVGSVGVLDYRRQLQPPLQDPELGWGVAPRFQGQGIAFEAVSAALAWCDESLNAPRTVCMIAPANRPSLALANRVGFQPYAETEYRGEPVILLQRQAA